ncbi:hypothetical protein ACFL08_04995 [Patescibacteria group bacterium]
MRDIIGKNSPNPNQSNGLLFLFFAGYAVKAATANRVNPSMNKPLDVFFE